MGREGRRREEKKRGGRRELGKLMREIPSFGAHIFAVLCHEWSTFSVLAWLPDLISTRKYPTANVPSSFSSIASAECRHLPITFVTATYHHLDMQNLERALSVTCSSLRSFHE